MDNLIKLFILYGDYIKTPNKKIDNNKNIIIRLSYPLFQKKKKRN